MNPFKDDTENARFPAPLGFEGTSATEALSIQWSQTGAVEHTGITGMNPRVRIKEYKWMVK